RDIGRAYILNPTVDLICGSSTNPKVPATYCSSSMAPVTGDPIQVKVTHSAYKTFVDIVGNVDCGGEAFLSFCLPGVDPADVFVSRTLVCKASEEEAPCEMTTEIKYGTMANNGTFNETSNDEETTEAPCNDGKRSLDENALQHQFLTASPNPSNGPVHLEWRTMSSSHGTIELFDAQGKRIKAIFTGDLKAGHLQQADIPALPEGIYIVRLAADNGTFLHTRFIIQK
ncbi:MAG: T9SS type A sorting domain-containing protein, partial [Bacteroidota bacterium]